MDSVEAEGIHCIANSGASVSGQDYDIFALHGLGGDWQQTWTSQETGYCFLKDTLPAKFPSCRILSYQCSDIARNITQRDYSGIVQDLIDDRRIAGRTQCPVILIGHSLGGVVLKDIFVATHPSRSRNPDYNHLHHSIRGYVFIGTPHRTISFDPMFTPWALGQVHNEFGTHWINTLQRSIQMISTIDSDFHRVNGQKLFNVCCFETRQSCSGMIQRYVVTPNQATLISVTTEVCPLNATHAELCMFTSEQDPAGVRVLARLGDLWTKLTRDASLAASQPQQPASSTPIRLLSLDGGGVRGLFSILVLERLMEEIRHQSGLASLPKPCEVFHLIGGTSTGGLIAIMLGRLQMDIAACKLAYLELSRKIFNPIYITTVGKYFYASIGVKWFNADILTEAIQGVVAAYLSPHERDNLQASATPAKEAQMIFETPSKALTFVCAIRETSHECDRIRTYESGAAEVSGSIPIWQAARATSAAPLYFKPIEINGRRYFDGGMQSNNPILEVVEEAFLHFGDDANIGSIVSLGTGQCEAFEPAGSLIDVVKSLAKRSTNTEAKHTEFMRRTAYSQLHDIYFRLQGSLALGAIDLAASDRLEEIERHAEAYLQSTDGQESLRKCAALFLS